MHNATLNLKKNMVCLTAITELEHEYLLARKRKLAVAGMQCRKNSKAEGENLYEQRRKCICYWT